MALSQAASVVCAGVLPFTNSTTVYVLLLSISCMLAGVVYVRHYWKCQLELENPQERSCNLARRLSANMVTTWSCFIATHFADWMFSGSFSPIKFCVDTIIDTRSKCVMTTFMLEADSAFDHILRHEAQVAKTHSAIAIELLTLIDTANAPIFGVDTQLLITEWNQTVAHISGYSKEEVLGKPLVDTFITPEYRNPVRQLLTAAATGGEQAASYEFPLYTRSGDRRELLLNATTRRDGDGEIVGVLGVGLDMTEARSVQRQLANSERVKVAMWGCIREGVATVEGSDALDGVILECNSAMCNLCGVSAPDQLQGTTLRQILVHSGQDVAQISKSMSHGQILEFCLQGSDNIFKTCEATFMEIPDLNAEESVTRLALVVRDRTWKKELEHQVT